MIDPLQPLLKAASLALTSREPKDLDVLRSRVDEARAHDWFATPFRQWLQRMQDDAQVIPDACVAGKWTLFQDATITASWQLEARGPASTLFAGTADSTFVVPNPQDGIRLRSYRSDRPIRNDVFDPQARLVPEDEVLIDRACIVRPDSEFGTAYEIVADQPVAILRIALRQRSDFVWDFDRATLSPRLLFPANILAARRRLMLDFLQASSHPDVERFADMLLESREYFLRWSGMQAIVERNPSRMREILDRGCADDHPEIRGTAARVLAQLGAENAAT